MPIVKVDWLISEAFRWNAHYWRDTFAKKLAPSSAFWILERSVQSAVRFQMLFAACEKTVEISKMLDDIAGDDDIESTPQVEIFCVG